MRKRRRQNNSETRATKVKKQPRIWVIYTSVPELAGEDEFELHEGHAFGDDGQGNEAGRQELAEIVDRGVVDLVDAERQAVRAAIRHEFALVGVHLLDDIMEFFEEGGEVQIRSGAHECLAGQPAALVVRIKDFEIIPFDFDDQPQLFRELKLVSIVA
jgi:hypothetical protein